MLALCASRDDPAAWLDTGETLSALWLRATRAGFSVVPLSQIVEVDATREALRREVFHDMAQPQLLVRIGWQEVTRPPLPPTPRRQMDDVLEPLARREPVITRPLVVPTPVALAAHLGGAAAGS